MKTKIRFIALSIGMLFFTPCEAQDECKLGNVVVDCEESKVYEAFIQKELIINQSFSKFSEALTLEGNLALREDIVQYYHGNKERLQNVYKKVKDSIFGSRSPKEIFEMRNGEIKFYKDKIESKKKAEEFAQTLNIKKYEVDTSFWEGAEKTRVLVWRIHNTSDRIINGIAVNEIYEKNGELIQPRRATTFLFSNEMILPTPIGDAVVNPNDTLVLTFNTSEEKVAKPEIVKFFFK